mgnify:CR=1 FL=1
MTTTLPVGRFAPSPTGPLHGGSLIAAIGSFCLARRLGGCWLLRMEDLDTPRVVPGAADQILHTLERLGLHWDGEILWQSRRQQVYQQALEQLTERGMIFPCGCSRKEILASAPHPGEDGVVYPGHCRNGLAPGRRARALRVRVPSQVVCFTDGVFGPIAQDLKEAVGDFVLKRADGLFAYQLAVVVDDAECGVSQVVRGADLLTSTPRQIFLHAALGNAIPDYVHLPLATDGTGEKISKRHGAAIRCGDSMAVIAALQFLGQPVPKEMEGAPPQQILAWAVAHFDISRIPAAQSGLTLSTTKKTVPPLTAAQNAVK